MCIRDRAEHIFTGELVPAVMGGKWVAEAEELKIGYDGKAIAELSLRIRRGPVSYTHLDVYKRQHSYYSDSCSV